MRYIVLPVGCLALAALGAGTMAAQERPAELTGCYDITAPDLLTDDKVGSGSDSEIPRRIEFTGPAPALYVGDTLRTEIVVPEGALPSAHPMMWGEIIGDSLNVSFSTGFSGVTATVGWAGDRWSGVARHRYDVNPHLIDAGPIKLTRVSCDSPPPVSIDAMLPIARSVELVGGLVITLRTASRSSEDDSGTRKHPDRGWRSDYGDLRWCGLGYGRRAVAAASYAHMGALLRPQCLFEREDPLAPRLWRSPGR